jgi:hypothetical protein
MSLQPFEQLYVNTYCVSNSQIEKELKQNEKAIKANCARLSKEMKKNGSLSKHEKTYSDTYCGPKNQIKAALKKTEKIIKTECVRLSKKMKKGGNLTKRVKRRTTRTRH